MPYLRTKLATDFHEPLNWLQRLVTRMDSANSRYRGKLHLVRWWLIEFSDDGEPFREIALDAQEAVVFAGPGDRAYGFWLDTSMRYADFEGEPITQEYFEQMWAASGMTPP
jgi:hypothetical protein